MKYPVLSKARKSKNHLNVSQGSSQVYTRRTRIHHSWKAPEATSSRSMVEVRSSRS